MYNAPFLGRSSPLSGGGGGSPASIKTIHVYNSSSNHSSWFIMNQIRYSKSTNKNKNRNNIMHHF